MVSIKVLFIVANRIVRWMPEFLPIFKLSLPKCDPIFLFFTTLVDQIYSLFTTQIWSNLFVCHYPNWLQYIGISPPKFTYFFAFHYSNVIHFLAFHYLILIPCLGFHFPILIPYFVFWLPEFDLIFRVFIIQVPSVLPTPQFYGWTQFQKFWQHNTNVSLSSGLFYKNGTDISNLAGSVKTEVNYPETLFVSKITFRILSSK